MGTLKEQIIEQERAHLERAKFCGRVISALEHLDLATFTGLFREAIDDPGKADAFRLVLDALPQSSAPWREALNGH